MDLKEIIPLLAAIIGLTPVFLNWLNERSSVAAKKKSIEQAKQQVELWEMWLKAQREVTSDDRYKELKNEISQRLDSLLQKSIEVEKQEEDKKDGVENHFFLQKLFLLYMPHTPSGWIFHTLFYITISFASMMSLGLSIDKNGEASWDFFKEDLAMNIAILLFFVIIAIIFQRLARHSEIHYAKKAELKENK